MIPPCLQTHTHVYIYTQTHTHIYICSDIQLISTSPPKLCWCQQGHWSASTREGREFITHRSSVPISQALVTEGAAPRTWLHPCTAGTQPWHTLLSPTTAEGSAGHGPISNRMRAASTPRLCSNNTTCLSQCSHSCARLPLPLLIFLSHSLSFPRSILKEYPLGHESIPTLLSGVGRPPQPASPAPVVLPLRKGQEPSEEFRACSWQAERSSGGHSTEFRAPTEGKGLHQHRPSDTIHRGLAGAGVRKEGHHWSYYKCQGEAQALLDPTLTDAGAARPCRMLPSSDPAAGPMPGSPSGHRLPASGWLQSSSSPAGLLEATFQ